MLKIICVLLLSLNISAFSADVESADYKEVVSKFINYYNANDFDGIFNMYSQEMKEALSLEKTKDFLGNLKSQAGKLVKCTFENYRNMYAGYKAKFERLNMTMNIYMTDKKEITGLLFKPYESENIPILTRNKTLLDLPFNGEWTVFWGGDMKELNYHVESKAQKNAFDFIITNKDGNSYKTDGLKNEDYYAFGYEVLAPCDGDIVSVVDGVKDNKPGDLNTYYVTGNSVIIKTANNEFLFFAHFKYRSIKVAEGQHVSKGQVVGLCGNTGNSTEPHIHFHIQNVEDMNIATGVKCCFEKISVNGQTVKDYSPIKGDKIKKID